MSHSLVPLDIVSYRYRPRPRHRYVFDHFETYLLTHSLFYSFYQIRRYFFVYLSTYLLKYTLTYVLTCLLKRVITRRVRIRFVESWFKTVTWEQDPLDRFLPCFLGGFWVPSKLLVVGYLPIPTVMTRGKRQIPGLPDVGTHHWSAETSRGPQTTQRTDLIEDRDRVPLRFSEINRFHVSPPPSRITPRLVRVSPNDT